MQVQLVTPERKLFSTEAVEITLTGALGQMTVLPGHIPVVTALEPGPLVIKKANGTTEVYAVGGGVAQIDRDMITVLAEVAEAAEEIDPARAEKARDQAMKLMQEQSAYDETFAETQAAVARATARLTISKR